MEKATARAIKRLDRIAAVFAALPLVGAEEYANGRLRAKPIVSRHFTAGNQQRYGWAPLSRDYYRAKQRGIVRRGGALHFLDLDQRAQLRSLEVEQKAGLKSLRGSGNAALRRAQKARNRADRGKLLDSFIKGRQGSKLDKAAEFQSDTGDMMGIGAAANLPMLVRSGKMRQAVLSRTHRMIHSGDTCWAVFGNLPVYALAHHKGVGRLPKRSPVEPNAEDRAEVVKVMQRQLDVAIGTGGDVPVSARSIPGRARFG